MVLREGRREEEIYPKTASNFNSLIDDVNRSNVNLSSDMGCINNTDDSDDSEEMPPDLINDKENVKRESENHDNCYQQEMSYNAPNFERRYSREAGDVYNNTIRAESLNTLTIGPVVENHHQYKRHRRISTCSSNNNLSQTNSNNAISNNAINEAMDTVLEMQPNPTPTNDKDVILESPSDDENENGCDKNINDIENDSDSNTSPPCKPQFDTKVNIRMPNEGPPKIEIQQQIENNYHGPVYMLDAETTKKLILDNPNIIAQICNREMASIPKINHASPKEKCNGENSVEQKESSFETIHEEKILSTNMTRQRVQWNQKSCRKRNQRHDDCSNDTSTVSFYLHYVTTVRVTKLVDIQQNVYAID